MLQLKEVKAETTIAEMAMEIDDLRSAFRMQEMQLSIVTMERDDFAREQLSPVEHLSEPASPQATAEVTPQRGSLLKLAIRPAEADSECKVEAGRRSSSFQSPLPLPPMPRTPPPAPDQAREHKKKQIEQPEKQMEVEEGKPEEPKEAVPIVLPEEAVAVTILPAAKITSQADRIQRVSVTSSVASHYGSSCVIASNMDNSQSPQSQASTQQLHSLEELANQLVSGGRVYLDASIEPLRSAPATPRKLTWELEPRDSVATLKPRSSSEHFVAPTQLTLERPQTVPLAATVIQHLRASSTPRRPSVALEMRMSTTQPRRVKEPQSSMMSKSSLPSQPSVHSCPLSVSSPLLVPAQPSPALSLRMPR